MVRGEADQVFREAFQGRTIHDIVFAARYAKKYGRDGSTARSATHRADGLAKSGADLTRESPEEAMQTTAGEVARMYETRFKHVDPKLVKVHLTTNAGEPAPAPAAHMPFRPFAGTQLPPGVTAATAPVAEPAVELKDTDEFRVEVDERGWRDLNLPKGYGADVLDSPTYAKRLARNHADLYNQGMLCSARRPY